MIPLRLATAGMGKQNLSRHGYNKFIPVDGAHHYD